MAVQDRPLDEREGSALGLASCTIHVCTACRRARADLPDGYDRPGIALAEALAAQIEGLGGAISVEPVECLSVCKRPCTVALTGAGKWTYVYGDLDPHSAVETLIAFASQYGATPDGIVPWRERPETIRKSVVARIPPLSITRQPS